MNKNIKIQGWKITEQLSSYLEERGFHIQNTKIA